MLKFTFKYQTHAAQHSIHTTWNTCCHNTVKRMTMYSFFLSFFLSFSLSLSLSLTHSLTHSLTYLLTPWSRVLLEKLTGSAASQEIPHIFGSRRFLTVPTSVRHLSLSWANSIQSPQPPPTSWRPILILSSHLLLGLPQCYLLTYSLTHSLTHSLT